MGATNRSESGINIPLPCNERGAALIIVLVMLLLLCILGASMMATSTSELKITGNYRNSEEAFYTGEALLDLASVHKDIYTAITPSVTSWPDKGDGKLLGDDLESDGSNTDNGKNPYYRDYNRMTFLTANNYEVEADVKVEFLHDGPPLAGSGTQYDSSVGTGGSGDYKANYYAVTVLTYGNNGTVEKLESQVARTVPK